jgi:hypothetical protein
MLVATASTSGTRSSATTRGSWLVRIVISAAVLGVLLLAAVMWIGIFGSIRGEEFSPDTFKRRTFEYQEVPLLGWRIGSVWHEDVSGPLERGLQIQRDLLPASPHASPRWDLIAMVHGAESYRGDAEILRRYLTAGDETSPYWLEWTQRHADLAKVFWPIVAATARSGQYVRLPELFETAERLTVAADVKPTVDEFRDALAKASPKT